MFFSGSQATCYGSESLKSSGGFFFDGNLVNDFVSLRCVSRFLLHGNLENDSLSLRCDDFMTGILCECIYLRELAEPNVSERYS